MSSEINDEIVEAATVVGYANFLAYMDTYMNKGPMHTNPQSGDACVQYLLDGNPANCRSMIRVTPHVFGHLCHTLRTRYGYNGTRRIRLEESVAITLHILGSGNSNKAVQDRFQHSGETVSRHLEMAVTLLADVMGPDIIKPIDPAFPTVPPNIHNSNRYWPHFQDCIGAIDGVHVPVVVAADEQHPYRGRKGITTTNCMCACDFDMKFTFACVGWEGSEHDTRIFFSCLNDDNYNFPKPPTGQYYLVDSGYPMKKGFVAPYKGERYHLPDFPRGKIIEKPEEKFNYLHSSLRSIIERTFGVWKNRWKILRNMPSYPLRTQYQIIVATMVLHNFIRANANNARRVSSSRQGRVPSSAERYYDEEATVISVLDEPEMKVVRDRITASICGVPL